MNETILIAENDSVLVALSDLEKGKSYAGVTALEDIRRGHKMAVRDIKAGEKVIKYGFPIGIALSPFPPAAMYTRIT